ncbi:LOW QUALITY PROTEIN: uncharacterized protein C13orf42 homolog [Melanerpes formicivorus]|uniref:LOW QUALITY PROTEIN: uncharacterized protein C13orf42 homolog n=1 Tax=Melanerpes formicivorus TaxID=211600 RepID=UPI00358F51D2
MLFRPRENVSVLRDQIHSIFHPNSQRRNVTDDIPYCDGTGSAVRLIRSTSMYILGGDQEKVSEPLKKSRSTTSIDSCFQPREEDKDWMYSKTQDCLKYLQDLLALRKKYLDHINNLKSMRMAAESPSSTTSCKTGKKSFLPLPSKESSKASMERKGPQSSSDVREAMAFFDSVIADLDSETRRRVPEAELPNVDVDVDGAVSPRQNRIRFGYPEHTSIIRDLYSDDDGEQMAAHEEQAVPGSSSYESCIINSLTDKQVLKEDLVMKEEWKLFTAGKEGTNGITIARSSVRKIPAQHGPIQHLLRTTPLGVTDQQQSKAGSQWTFSSP